MAPRNPFPMGVASSQRDPASFLIKCFCTFIRKQPCLFLRMRVSGDTPHFQNELAYFIFILLHLPYKHHNTSDEVSMYCCTFIFSRVVRYLFPLGLNIKIASDKLYQSLIYITTDLQGCFTDNLCVRAFRNTRLGTKVSSAGS